MHDDHLKSTARTIREGRTALGMNARQFAEAVGVSRSAVEHWERKRGAAPSRANQRKVAQVLGISVVQLMTGEPGSRQGGLAPVVTEPAHPVVVGAEDLIRASVARTPVLTRVNERTFAWRVHGDSMVGDARDSFPSEAIVVVEPDMAALPGDYVVAQVDADGLTLRQLVQDAGESYLKPLNVRYPLMPLDAAHILGVVREVSRVYR